MDSFPEHEKLALVQPFSQACGAFLEWLEEQGFSICEVEEWGDGDFHPVRKSREKLLAEHFEIDLDALESEKEAMIAALNPTLTGGG